MNLPYEYKDKCQKRLFVIFFERSTSKFYFRSLRESEIYIYVKINKDYPLTKKKYYQIGDIVFHAEPVNETGLKVVIHSDDNKKGKKNYVEHFFDINNGDVFIGRSEICNIKLDENILSKIHCSFKYDKAKKMWLISDGNGERPSTNGTWMFCNSKYELIENETQAKIGKSIITIKKM